MSFDGRRQWHPTPVLLPGKSHGWRSLVGCSPWGREVGHDWATSLSLFTFMHWRRKWQPTPAFLPRESQGWRSLVGCRLWGRTELDTTEWLHFHFSLSGTGEGNGNPLQCSCLENPRDGGAWWAAIYGVPQSQTRPKRLSSSSSRLFIERISFCLKIHCRTDQTSVDITELFLVFISLSFNNGIVVIFLKCPCILKIHTEVFTREIMWYLEFSSKHSKDMDETWGPCIDDTCWSWVRGTWEITVLSHYFGLCLKISLLLKKGIPVISPCNKYIW